MSKFDIDDPEQRSAIARIREFIKRKPYSPKGHYLPKELAFELQTPDDIYDICHGVTVWMTGGNDHPLHITLEAKGVQLTFVEKETADSDVKKELMSYKRIGQNRVSVFSRPTKRPTYSTA